MTVEQAAHRYGINLDKLVNDLNEAQKVNS